jgi:hypothetical protein
MIIQRNTTCRLLQKIKVQFTVEQATKAQRDGESRDRALLFF